jgi:hypothetical protein
MLLPVDEKEVEHLARLTHRQRARSPGNQAVLAFIEPQVLAMNDLWQSLGLGWPDLTPALVHIAMDQAYRAQGELPSTASKTYFDLLFAQLMCRRSHDPIWALDEDCARALAETDPPFDVVSEEIMEGRLRLPYPGLYMAIPPVFALHDPATGDHDVEGIYLADAWTLPITLAEMAQYGTALEARRHHAPVRGMVVVAVGRAKGTYRGPRGEADINDTLRSVLLGPSIDLRMFDGDPGFAAVTHLAINFLLALNANYLDVQEVRPVPPKNPRKAEMRERRGELMERHTRVRLGGRAVAARAARSASERGARAADLTAAQRAARLVRGHWHHYWVADPGEESILAIKPGKTGVLHLVAKWLMPYYRGDGDPRSPSYRVSGAPLGPGKSPCG